jgi:micrococcal nuclease
VRPWWLPLAPLALSPQTYASGCDPSYPDVCIPSPPPDLDCGEIAHRRFRVVGADPHRFDGDRDGIGCESD